MKTIYCAAVDLGATSGRVIVGAWKNHRLQLTEVRRFPNQFRSVGAHDYWDIPYLWNEVRAGLIAAQKQFPKIASVGVASWAVDTVLTDAAGRMVFPTHAYRDARTASASAALERRGIDRIYQLTGVPNYAYNTSLQLQEVLTARPAMAKVATRCLFISDYFNFLLSGRMENELSIASHSQLLDVQGVDWSSAALKHFGIPASWFSTPALSPRKLGQVVGIPELKSAQALLVPGHDTACAFTAMPAAENGKDLYLSSGTWSLLGFESEQPVLGPSAQKARVSNERMGDGRYRPLCSCLGLWLIEQLLPAFASRPKTAHDWQKLIAASSQAPVSRGMLDVKDQSLFKPASMRAAIDAQLRKRKISPPRDLAGYFRLICDSLGRGHAETARDFERLASRKFERILIVGGGSKNRLLCQATADAARLPVVSFALEGTAVGNIASQLIALGVVGDLPEFRRHLQNGLKQTIYQPRD